MSQHASATKTATVLLELFRLNETLTLKNRIVMAPMTRCMADDQLVPTEAMAAYYARRADVGLIISEATVIRADGQGYPNTPGLFSDAQIEGWRAVTDQVHASGGLMFAQIWHVGRISHPVYLDGKMPIAPSAVTPSGKVARTEYEYETPRALDIEELPAVVEAFAQGAANAIAAGFDGVEIHGANGYLIDQFLHYDTNRRTDEYGETPERMTRFPLEVTDAVAERIGRDRVGIRLSPGAYMNEIAPNPRDAIAAKHLLSQLNDRKLAYVHTGIFDDAMTFDYLDGSAGAFLRKHYEGILIGNGSYSTERAASAIDNNEFDLAAIGRPLIANPDLVAKVKDGLDQIPYDQAMLATLG